MVLLRYVILRYGTQGSLSAKEKGGGGDSLFQITESSIEMHCEKRCIPIKKNDKNSKRLFMKIILVHDKKLSNENQ